MPTQCYHKTTRERALEILAHGFAEHDCVEFAGDAGVPFYAFPAIGNPLVDVNPVTGDTHALFQVVSIKTPEGDDLLAGIAREDPGFDPKDWQRMPLSNVLGDNYALTIIRAVFPDDVPPDQHRCEMGVQLWNRRTQATRNTNSFA